MTPRAPAGTPTPSSSAAVTHPPSGARSDDVLEVGEQGSEEERVATVYRRNCRRRRRVGVDRSAGRELADLAPVEAVRHDDVDLRSVPRSPSTWRLCRAGSVVPSPPAPSRNGPPHQMSEQQQRGGSAHCRSSTTSSNGRSRRSIPPERPRLEQPPPLGFGILAGVSAATPSRGASSGHRCTRSAPLAHHAPQRHVRARRQPRPEGLDHRLIRRGQTFLATAVQHGEPATDRVGGDRRGQPCLADARLTDDQRRPRRASSDLVQQRTDPGQLAATPHQPVRAADASAAGNERRPPRRRPTRTPRSAPRSPATPAHPPAATPGPIVPDSAARSRQRPAPSRLPPRRTTGSPRSPPPPSSHRLAHHVTAAHPHPQIQLVAADPQTPSHRLQCAAASNAVTALANVAITPSPRLFTTVPPDDVTTSRLARSNSADAHQRRRRRPGAPRRRTHHIGEHHRHRLRRDRAHTPQYGAPRTTSAGDAEYSPLCVHPACSRRLCRHRARRLTSRPRRAGAAWRTVSDAGVDRLTCRADMCRALVDDDDIHRAVPRRSPRSPFAYALEKRFERAGSAVLLASGIGGRQTLPGLPLQCRHRSAS